MEQHDHQALKDVSVKMKKDRYSAKHTKFENEFFFPMEADERLKAKRKKLHEDVDDLLTNEQRLRFRNKAASVAKALEQTSPASSSSAEPSTTSHSQVTAKHARGKTTKNNHQEKLSIHDHLVGPGTTSSRLKTPARLRIQDVDVSQVLLDAGRQVIANQCNINNISDLLALNFIFDTKYIRKHLASEVFTKIPRVPTPIPANNEIQVLSECSIFAATHSFLETKQFFRNHIQAGTVIEEVLKAYTTRPTLWRDLSLQSSAELTPPRNGDTSTDAVVESIIIGVFGGLDAADHWRRYSIPTPQGFEEKYIPDYYAEKVGLPFIVVETFAAGVPEPVVVGLLICAMTLKYEAIYMYETLGEFELPRNNLQLGLLLPALSPLIAIQRVAKTTLEAINNRVIDHDPTARWRRPSYYIRGIKIPAPPPLPPPSTVDSDADDDQEAK
ncbi:hypothetical protein BC939DRAFT_506156 [Gamsiella multidivaricata]|uniref:uncharacterized protein n=1 Tax=Gamsiella multidivaricata TaxID=101098 RepID=UPI00221F9EE6|nr:uncharacterized protein BC939DRAFT_506156 [Gamsiella multidivaricata]KAI7818936.1 hypothetical protein BC939DRAFT_506156 [Gamsiella multidivaricata]